MAERTAGAPIQFGVNLNNREPLIAPDYDLRRCSTSPSCVEELGFDSVWVGDSLFSKPRYEAMTLLAAISQRTKRVRLGTACLVSSMRNPLYLALEWATLDQISGGRTIFGPCMGNPEQGVRREFEALGLPVRRPRDGLRGGPRGRRRAVPHRPHELQGQVLQLRRRRLPLGHRDGAAAADPAAAADLDRLQPAPGRRQADREDARDHGARLRPDHPPRRRLDDLLPRRAPRGADRADRLSARRRRRATAATSTTTPSPTR